MKLAGVGLGHALRRFADLTDAYLHRADLVGAKLDGADLTGAEATEANFEATRLSAAKGFGAAEGLNRGEWR